MSDMKPYPLSQEEWKQVIAIPAVREAWGLATRSPIAGRGISGFAVRNGPGNEDCAGGGGTIGSDANSRAVRIHERRSGTTALGSRKVVPAYLPEYGEAPVTANILDLASLGFPTPVIEEWNKRYPGGLNALQLEAVNRYRITQGASLVVVAPTSAGKTFIGELAAAKAVVEGRKAVFLFAYKALVNEKYDQFVEFYGDKLQMRVIRCTGDYSDQAEAFVRGKFDLAVLTYEMFLQLVVSVPATLNQLGLVVLDEAQFITDPTRGMTVELILTSLLAAREKGISPQIIALSAVRADRLPSFFPLTLHRRFFPAPLRSTVELTPTTVFCP